MAEDGEKQDEEKEPHPGPLRGRGRWTLGPLHDPLNRRGRWALRPLPGPLQRRRGWALCRIMQGEQYVAYELINGHDRFVKISQNNHFVLDTSLSFNTILALFYS